MKPPKAWKLLSTLLFCYAVRVLVFRFGRNGTPWDRAFPFASAGAPLLLVPGRLRDERNASAREAGRRLRERCRH
ncbi:hypothetical protein [Streptomyces tropicalis]|uniref:Secreted protein n=1 Tax=Streptomyces tropicalis TaxID=3034234 RepID=A0ABT5ZYF2_9ACTN|nr:hypothetical protein [Streptomyces tropicalis]MDF3297421.1 hypothetical protein [Streptomyces tropicalis]